MKIHEKIRLVRESKSWSQEYMAEKLGMSLNGYAKIERGETKAYNPKLEQIADILEIDLAELMPDDKHICVISGDNSTNGHNITFGSSVELAFENRKLQMQLELKNKELALQAREIVNLQEQVLQLKEINALLKKEV
jgi:transcriptional regulator with XRE-family HTH domain